MSVAIIARGAASALGVGAAAFEVGAVDEPARSAWSARPPGRPFGRVTACQAPRAARPRALFELGLEQVVAELDALEPAWRARRLGVVVGTSSGGFAALERALATQASGADSDAPEWAHSTYFAPLARAAELLGRAPERLVSLYGACASSALALGLGMRWLELGYLDLVIAGGYDAESDWVCAGFDSLKATSAGPPRPFRVERDGMALGEGVALVALERARGRGYGFMLGFAATTDAVHITAPDRHGSGLARAAMQALAEAGIGSQDIDLVSAHGTGTSFNDASEAAALTQLFGARKGRVPLHAFKPAVGHTLGAASALESLAALSALERGIAPASCSQGTPMPELPARLLAQNEPARLERCLKLATAFGGANAALVLSRSSAATLAARAPRPVHLVAMGSAVSELELERVRPLLHAPSERLPRSDTLSSLAIAAAAEALRALDVAELERARVGVVVGSVGATLEANAQFSLRVLARGGEHAEPRRFPATSPNVCAGHVAIAFGLGGPSHAVGAGADAALEALATARDWVAAGDADAMLVIAAEQVGSTSRAALASHGIPALEQGAIALVLSARPEGPELHEGLIEQVRRQLGPGKTAGFRGLEAFGAAARLPGSGGFGSVGAPE